MNAYTYNVELNGIEVTFDEKPIQAVRDLLKDAGFRWHRAKKLWYAKRTDATEAAAKEAVGIEAKEVDYSDWSGTASAGYMGAIRWDGSNSHKGLYGAELSRAIRNDIKAHCITGVTISCGRGGWTDKITATIKCSPSDFTDYKAFSDHFNSWNDTFDIYHGLSDEQRSWVSPALARKIWLVNSCLDSYVYDDSNAMVDYFNTNMYYNIVLKVKGGESK